MIVDAHVHLWDRQHTPQPWMTAEHAAIARPFGPADLCPLLERNGIDAVVLVQGACLDSDTDSLLAEAARHNWIAAVTAWLALDQPERAAARLDELVAHSTFRAVRHLVHDEDDPHWILRSPVLESLALLEQRNVILELPAVFPRHLADVPSLAKRFPRLTIVIDHLGKPPIGRDGMARWAADLRAAAACPNVVAKLSGLNTAIERSDWRAEDLLPACAVAFDCFGADRLMCGSDWPVLLLNGEYGRVWESTRHIVDTLAPGDLAALLGGNAARVYGFASAGADAPRKEEAVGWPRR
jgi:L-fuconolactonase